MSVLTTSQLTFCDLKDSYSIYMDTDCIGIACNSNGLVLESQTITINYHVLAGSTHVNASCEVSELPSGVTLTNSTSALDGKTGTIVLNVAQNATLGNEPTSSLKVVFKTNNAEEFTFEKYITFVKYMNGADGTDAVDFQIYSVDGFEFSEELAEITLSTIAFEAGVEITTGATYQWSWWNRVANNGAGEYINIPDATSKTLSVNVLYDYAFTNLKCTMTYGEIDYEDHVSLTKKISNYESIVKFFDGSNIFTSEDLYLLAYVEVYQDGNKVETVFDFANQYCNGVSEVSSSGVITSNVQGKFSDGEKMFFICQKDDSYEVILGEYSSGVWRKVNYTTRYTYTNTFSDTASNVIVISKEKINKALNIDFTVYKDNAPIANSSISVIDSNDPIISNNQPDGVVVGQLWLNTSVTPNILMIYEGNGNWKQCAEKIGGNVFTSEPSNYSIGDLWILGENETYQSPKDGYMFGPGSMLKAIEFNGELCWVDADTDSTEVKNNIKQYFLFNPSTGLRIGQSDNKFYVNISSTRMSFCENPNINSPEVEEKIDPNEIVSISNKSATIKNAKLEGNTEFYGQINICDPSSNSRDNKDDSLFIWKIEQDGSLSLALA